ncbi:MAG: hypothetical protein WCV90_08085 [Candidatus Woesearchaeota archaeon]
MLPDFQDIEKQLTQRFSLSELEARLRPDDKSGVWTGASEGGFLAPKESLIDVVRADYETLQRLGLDYEEMARMADVVVNPPKKETVPRGRWARFMDRLRGKKQDDLSRGDSTFNFLPIGSCGAQGCPWGCSGKDHFGYNTWSGNHTYVVRKGEFPGVKPGGDFADINRQLYLGSFAVVTGLTPHLIASHYFFEGGDSYRTDPAKLLEIFNSLQKKR